MRPDVDGDQTIGKVLTLARRSGPAVIHRVAPSVISPSPAWESWVDRGVRLDVYLRAGGRFAAISTDLATLTGQPAASFESFVSSWGQA